MLILLAFGLLVLVTIIALSSHSIWKRRRKQHEGFEMAMRKEFPDDQMKK